MASSSSKQDRPEAVSLLIPWLYDLFLWLFTVCIQIFFREMYPRGAWRIPKKGPLIIVAGPHANQFIDSIVLMHVLKAFAGRRISFLIAEKSMKEPYIGKLAASFGTLPVARSQDNLKSRPGKLYLPDAENDPTLIRGIGTDFHDPQFTKGGTIVLPKVGKTAPPSTTISEILGPQELRLKNPLELPEKLKLAMISKDGQAAGVSFKVAPHIDQTQVFNKASSHLLRGGCIGIFPEGGSHDRPDLLPLKAGVSIMALNTLAKDEDSGLTIIPCGMNYFHPNKFRSRAVVEFGSAIPVNPELITAFRAGGIERRNAVGALLETIHEGLLGVTQVCPDYETLLLVQAARRLYKPFHSKQPLSNVVDMNRRLIKGFTRFADDPRIKDLKRAILQYNEKLLTLGIVDHQVAWGNFDNRPQWLALATLFYRVAKLICLGIATLPGLLLFWPMFVTTKIISVRKQRAALAGSIVKIEGKDVVGTWKILVAVGLAPAVYLWYTAIATFWLYHNRTGGSLTPLAPPFLRACTYIPDWIPLSAFSIYFFCMMVVLTFAALRIGEVGMDILKSLPPLAVAVNPWSARSLQDVAVERRDLSVHVSKVINELRLDSPGDIDEDDIPDSQGSLATPASTELKPRHVRKGSDGLSLNSLAALTRTGSVFGGINEARRRAPH